MRRSRHRSTSALAAFGLLVTACATTEPVFEDPPQAEELYDKGLEIMKGTSILGLFTVVQYTVAIETFQSIIDNYPYSEYATLAELKIADAYFEDHAYDEALSYYRDFGDLHPQHEMVPYTVLRSALCKERQMNPANLDQTATRDALLYLDRLLATYPHSPQAQEGEILWRDLRTRLAENVTEIAKFYQKREEYESAAERYRTLLNEYPGLGLDAQALYNLGICYASMRRDEEAHRIFQSIVQNYADTEFAEDAAARIAALSEPK